MTYQELSDNYPLAYAELIRCNQKYSRGTFPMHYAINNSCAWSSTPQGSFFWAKLASGEKHQIAQAMDMFPNLFDTEELPLKNTHDGFIKGKWYQCSCNATISRYVGVSQHDTKRMHFDATFNPSTVRSSSWEPGMNVKTTDLALREYYNPNATVDMSRYANQIADTHKHLIT